MLWLLICAVAALVGSNWIAPQDSSYMEREDANAPPTARTTRPHVYYCRSPNMEDFTCWWRPLDSVSSGRPVDSVSSGRPVDSVSSRRPVDSVSSGGRPVDSVSSAGRPVDSVSSGRPVDSVSSGRPVEDNVSSAGRPVDSVSSGRPVEDNVSSSGRPVDSVSSGRPVDSVSSAGRPVDSVSSAGRPVDSVSSAGRPVDSVSSSGRPVDSVSSSGRPVDSVSSSGRPVEDNVSYVLTYSIDRKEPMHECPDYVTGGPHSCHFDKRYTSVWSLYCMTVTAITPLWNYTSHEHCLDVADIVQMEAPVNLSYSLMEAGGDEVGHTARLSWTYPVPSALQYDWITLLYELQYRHVAQNPQNPDNWKVKPRLREPHVELLGLPAGDYVLRVRCRSRNSDLWSRWSATLGMSIPARPPAGKMLVLILMTGFGMVVLLAISFGILPQSKRIRAYFLPPIPKPHILGIDPLLLKMGHIEEINRHFSSFHGYRPPSYGEEVWDCVSTDEHDDGFSPPAAAPTDPPRSGGTGDLPTDPPLSGGTGDLQADAAPPPPQADTAPLLLLDSLYVRSPPPSQHGCPAAPAPAVGSSFSTSTPPPPDVAAAAAGRREPWPGIVFLPGSDYSVMGGGGRCGGGGGDHPPAAAAPAPPPPPPPPAAMGPPAAPRSAQPDFYTCVQIMNETGEVHLVPCLRPTPTTPTPAAVGEEAPGRRRGDGGEEEEEGEGEGKKKQLSERRGRKTAASERGDVAPLLPVENKG